MLTENRMKRIVRESIANVLTEDWENDYNTFKDKQEYDVKKQEFDQKGLFKRMVARILRNAPKDPNPKATARELAQAYVDAFNQEHGLGKRTDYPEGGSFHSKMGWQSGSMEPVLSATRQDPDGWITQSRMAFDSDGSDREWGSEYPSDIASDGRPQPYEIGDNYDLKQKYQTFDKNRSEISNVLRKRNRR